MRSRTSSILLFLNACVFTIEKWEKDCFFCRHQGKKITKKSVKVYTKFIFKNILEVFKSLVQCPQTDNLK